MKTGFAGCLVSCGLSLILVVLSQRAAAETALVLFVSPEKTPFSARIRAEIEAMGFDVVSSETLDADSGVRADAAARVVESPPPRRIELWLRDEKIGRLALDRVLEVDPVEVETGAADATSAVRASEQLRAFFQPLSERATIDELMPPLATQPEPEPRVVPPEPPPTPASTRRPNESRFFQEMAGTVPILPGSLGLDLLLRTRQRFGLNYGVGAKLVLPLVSSTVRFLGNSADVSTSLFGAELWAFLVTNRVASLGTQAGFALLWLSASGKAQAPYTGQVDRKLTAMPSLGTELEVRLTRHARLCFGAELGVSVPKLQVAFAGQSVTAWARPLALFSAGLGVEWGDP